MPVLVTCTHVLAAAPHGPYFLVLRMPVEGANPGIVMLRIDVSPNSEHADQNIRDAMLRRWKSGCLQKSRASSASRRLSARAHWLGKLRLMLVMKFSCSDFPKYSPAPEGAFPVFRGGRIASYSSGSQADLEKYLIDTNVYSGDSGGPVFAARSHGAPELLGLVTERIGPKTGEVPLAVAIDSTVIRETLALLPRNLGGPDAGPFDRRFASSTVSTPTVKLVGFRIY